MAKLAELRKKAKEMQIAPSVIRSASTAAELQAVIDEFSGNGSKSKAKGKSAVKKAVKKKGTAATETPKKRGRPKGSKNKSSASKSAPAAKSTRGKAKRPTAAKSKATDSGKNFLEGIDYSATDGWNPREGSAPDRIIKALKKFKGNREKVYEFLRPNIWDFVSKKMRDGSKRPLKGDGYSAENMLKFRIARTDWDFAVRTGQHEASANRVEYGTGGTGQGLYKRGGKGKKAAAEAPKRRGRPKGSTNKAKAGKAASKAPTGRKRGRPKGSKNKK